MRVVGSGSLRRLTTMPEFSLRRAIHETHKNVVHVDADDLDRYGHFARAVSPNAN